MKKLVDCPTQLYRNLDFLLLCSMTKRKRTQEGILIWKTNKLAFPATNVKGRKKSRTSVVVIFGAYSNEMVLNTTTLKNSTGHWGQAEGPGFKANSFALFFFFSWVAFWVRFCPFLTSRANQGKSLWSKIAWTCEMRKSQFHDFTCTSWFWIQELANGNFWV